MTRQQNWKCKALFSIEALYFIQICLSIYLTIINQMTTESDKDKLFSSSLNFPSWAYDSCKFWYKGCLFFIMAYIRIIVWFGHVLVHVPTFGIATFYFIGRLSENYLDEMGIFSMFWKSSQRRIMGLRQYPFHFLTWMVKNPDLRCVIS